MFDPNLPATDSDMVSAEMRSQFNGLKALIDAISTITAAQVDSVNTLPPGSPAQVNLSVNGNTLHFSFDLPQGNDGNDGAQGPPFAQAVVDAVNTLEPWESATVDASFDGSNVRFTFGIPRGNDGSNGADGEQGPPGNDGIQGQPGNDGAQGPPFAQAVVGAVNTLEPWESATVDASFDGSNMRFTFGIPRGYAGSNGSDGEQGPPGNDGIQGQPGNDGAQGPPFAQAVVDGVNTLEPWESAAVDVSFDGSNVRFTFGIPRGNDGSNGSDGAPGEVSLQQLDDAISGTSANTNNVSTLDNSYADPEMEELRQKLNELILNGRRV